MDAHQRPPVEEDNLNNCHFQFGDKILDIKSEKMVKPDEAEKIKVTVFTSEGNDSNIMIRVFEIEESKIKSFIGQHVDEFFDITKKLSEQYDG